MNAVLPSLLRQPRRTILTIAGVAVGAGTYMLLVGSAGVGSMETAGFLPAHLSVAAILEGAVVSCLAGLLGAITPLLRAIRVPPADALRGL